ncbi:Acylphosphatase [Colletotrichum sojae]|uniref:acylphosphatase n=1 Tax=Colletotrichum sojae TaxID=2175907 RepID=A0A8H6MZU6_9PEZI|nr:Acylphosphatase [Colletotrichum sojae]
MSSEAFMGAGDKTAIKLIVADVTRSYFTQKRATEYGLTGWCRNTDNNKVEGEAQGDEDALQKLLKDIDQGPRSAKVVRLDHENRELVDGEKDFLVRR